jgi:outer membrane lipase/esterase
MKKRVLPALVLSAFAAAASPQAGAAQFSGVYVFGDSLSDAGFYRPFLSGLGLPAPVVSTLGRFTTNPGPVWSELVSTYYGVTPSPSNANSGNIFAQGGARVVADSAATPPGGAQRPVSTQINEYFARTGGTADPNALYAVWAGGNDFLQNSQAFAAGGITAAQFQANVLGAATAEVQQIGRLQAAGARYILAFGLPDIGGAPALTAAGPASAAGATALSAGFNTTLFTGLQSAGIKVIPVDTFALFNDIRTNGAAFGITNFTSIACGPFPPITSTNPSSQFCLPSNYVAANAATTYAFADSVHPTSVVHRITADFVEQLIEGPTQYGLLAEAALRSREGFTRMLEDGLYVGRAKPVSGWNVFASLDGGNQKIDAGAGNTGYDAHSHAYAVGVTLHASDALTVGVALGQSFINGGFGESGGGFRMREKLWSIFASLRSGGFWGTAVGTLGDLDYSSVQRNIFLGNVVRTANSNPGGSNGAASVNAGYDFSFGRFLVGPTVGVASQSVTVNGFDESAADAGSAALRIYDQTRRSEIWNVGVRASMDLGGWTPWLRVTADKERRDDERFVGATPISLVAIGNRYDIPAYVPDNNFVVSSIGVQGHPMPNLGVSVAGYYVSGRSGSSTTGANLMLAYKF